MTIKGAEILDTTTFPVVPGQYEWVDHGLELYIPEGSIDSSTFPHTIKIFASISGQYELPDNIDLVSGIYWIKCSQKFKKHPVTLKIEHCASIKNPEQLNSFCFITANCTQKMLPYKFEEIPGGEFSTDSCKGAIQLHHFSAQAVGKRKKPEEQKGEKRPKVDSETDSESIRTYTLFTCYFRQGINNWLAHVAIVWNLKTYLMVGLCLH